MLEQAISEALDSSGWQRLFLGLWVPPIQGQFVVTGPQDRNSMLLRVGHCVQVRRGDGVNGSDLVILRHANGALVGHEDQMFFRVPERRLARIRRLFGRWVPGREQVDGVLFDGVLAGGAVVTRKAPRIRVS